VVFWLSCGIVQCSSMMPTAWMPRYAHVDKAYFCRVDARYRLIHESLRELSTRFDWALICATVMSRLRCLRGKTHI
jgi:hypothetical protein